MAYSNSAKRDRVSPKNVRGTTYLAAWSSFRRFSSCRTATSLFLISSASPVVSVLLCPSTAAVVCRLSSRSMRAANCPTASLDDRNRFSASRRAARSSSDDRRAEPSADYVQNAMYIVPPKVHPFCLFIFAKLRSNMTPKVDKCRENKKYVLFSGTEYILSLYATKNGLEQIKQEVHR